MGVERAMVAMARDGVYMFEGSTRSKPAEQTRVSITQVVRG